MIEEVMLMPRPKKWRKVEFIPDIREFIPCGGPGSDVGTNVLKVEELEALRLKELEELDQEQCAEKMGVSRQTFQRILNSGRKKMVDSLVSGKGIRIEGGNFTRNVCPVQCLDCGREWDESYENYQKLLKGEYECSYCGSNRVVCIRGHKGKFCRGNCWRHGRNNK
jgi:predicted DNA-binding protein (UPF0251 family)/DNA-directed RNA polymerase subunit RPC12/RpoP